jgi:hypothetical protein
MFLKVREEKRYEKLQSQKLDSVVEAFLALVGGRLQLSPR